MQRLLHRFSARNRDGTSPPEYTAAVETPHKEGKRSEATSKSYETAESFCNKYRVDEPKFLPSNLVSELSLEGCTLWSMELPEPADDERFKNQVNYKAVSITSAGVIRVASTSGCKDTCIFSNWPIIAGLYATNGKKGVYYEVKILKMEGVIAIGNAIASQIHPCPHH